MGFKKDNGRAPSGSLLGAMCGFLLRQVRLLVSIPVWIVGVPLIWMGEKFNWKFTGTVADFLQLTAPNDRPYESTQNLAVDFKTGDKYFYVISSCEHLGKIIEAFVGVLGRRHASDDFVIGQSGEQAIIVAPAEINFHDYHLMVRYFSDELGSRKSFGIFKSESLQYFVFLDNEKPDSLVGFTSDRRFFSICLRDDLQKNQCLRLNQDLRVETEWIDPWTDSAAEKVFVRLRGAL